MKIWICSFIFFLSFIQLGFAEPVSPTKKNLAIVIDDLGNNMKGTEEILGLPINLTVAIMPFLSTTKEDAELAHHNGHEVIVHLPMEPKLAWSCPGAIKTDLSDSEVRKRS